MRLLIAFMLFFVLVHGDLNMINGKRGPHHPRGEFSHEKHAAEHLHHEKEHMEEDLKSWSISDKELSEMSEEEKNFYYFKIHDSDNNDNLDGLEMLHAATHRGSHFHSKDNRDEDLEKMEDELNHIIGVIDDFIDFADIDKNGLLNYPEYMKAIYSGGNATPKEMIMI